MKVLLPWVTIHAVDQRYSRENYIYGHAPCAEEDEMKGSFWSDEKHYWILKSNEEGNVKDWIDAGLRGEGWYLL